MEEFYLCILIKSGCLHQSCSSHVVVGSASTNGSEVRMLIGRVYRAHNLQSDHSSIAERTLNVEANV